MDIVFVVLHQMYLQRIQEKQECKMFDQHLAGMFQLHMVLMTLHLLYQHMILPDLEFKLCFLQYW
jgi:hypothetical protein